MRGGTTAAVLTLVANLTAAAPLPQPVWMCHPEMASDPCAQGRYPVDGHQVPLTTTDVTGGTGSSVPAQPPVDCFYVYPTVDNLPNLAPAPTDDEFAQTIAEIGVLAPRCRLFVPEYRQVTLLELALDLILHQPPDYATGAGDVELAWQDYWNHDNIDPVTHQRRGVVLLGHSQGASDVATLIQHDVDGHPDVQRQLVSAILLGGHITVPVGKPDGGGTDPRSTFQYVPACHRADQYGCVVAYSSYKPGGQVPGTSADLVRVNGSTDHQVLCVNPAGLLAGTDGPTPLDTVLYTRTLVEGNALNPYGHISSLGQSLSVPDYPTGFARYHGTLTGQCEQAQDSAGTVSWLDITGGDQLIGGPQSNFYGLHALDFNLTDGDIGELVAHQTAAWTAGTWFRTDGPLYIPERVVRTTANAATTPAAAHPTP
jgi:Protein of unknown function (DUF3089)